MIKANKVILKNSIYLLSRTILLTGISLFTIREVLYILGEKGYGLFSVIFGLVALFTFINGAMTASSQRFLSYKIGEKNDQGVRNTYLASLMLHIIIGVIVLVILLLSKDIFLNKVLNVRDFQYEAELLYNIASINVLVIILQSPMIALITSYEKMKIFAYISLFDAFSKLIVVYLLYVISINKVVMYGFLTLMISFVTLVFYSLVAKKIINKLNFVKERYIQEMMGMTNFMGWSLIGNFAWVCKNQGSNVLLNVFMGFQVNAAYAISIGITGAISNLLSSVSNAIKPQIFKNYAKNNMIHFFSLINTGTKYYISFMIIIIIPFLIYIDEILRVWLKNVPIYASDFCVLSLIVILVESYSVLLIAAVQATGKIKLNQIILGSILLLNIPISFYFLKQDYSANVIFYVSIFISIFSLFVRLLIVNKLVGFNVINFLKMVFFPSLLFFIICYVIAIIIKGEIFSSNSDIINLISGSILISIINLVIGYFVISSQAEKIMIQAFVKNFFVKRTK